MTHTTQHLAQINIGRPRYEAVVVETARCAWGEDSVADEPDNLVLRLLREVRASQDAHGSDLGYLKGEVGYLRGRVNDLYKISTHTLGVAVNAHERYEGLEAAVKELNERVQALEAKVV
jgi:hypothetical protein